jgi:hypothetical protein
VRKAARLVGLTWMATVAALAVWTLGYNSARFASFHLLIPVLVFCALPGAILVVWGRGPYVRPTTVAEALRPKAPYDRAAEAGHAMQIETDRHV